MDTATELLALKQEVAELKQQLTELRRFLHVDDSEGTPGQKILTVHCSGIFLLNPENPNEMQGTLTASEKGPSFALRGSDSKARIAMDVIEDHGMLTVYQRDLQLGVKVGENKQNEPGISLFTGDKPRVALKALPETGVISAVHDEGHTRVAVMSKPTHGEVFVVGGDLQAGVKLSADNTDGGGFIAVNHANGKGAVFLASTRVSGFVALSDSRGNILTTLPPTPPDS